MHNTIKRRSPLFRNFAVSLGLLFILFTTVLAAEEIELVGSIPYDKHIFTQGMVYSEGNLYISGGLYGESALYCYDLEKQNIEPIYRFDKDLFAEGITLMGDTLAVLTWKKEQGFYFSLTDKKMIGSFGYRGEGWGLTGRDRTELFLSNGSEYITRYEALDDQIVERGKFPVWDSSKIYNKLNELELIDRQIYANVWYDDVILVIDSDSGEVLEKLFPKEQIPAEELEGSGVLNGIAYNAEEEILYITGKNWNKIYLFNRVSAP